MKRVSDKEKQRLGSVIGGPDVLKAGQYLWNVNCKLVLQILLFSTFLQEILSSIKSFFGYIYSLPGREEAYKASLRKEDTE